MDETGEKGSPPVQLRTDGEVGLAPPDPQDPNAAIAFVKLFLRACQPLE